MVLGARGMLGTDLCKRLWDDFQVVEADIEEIDITDFGRLRRLVLDVGPDEVVNCAGFTDVDGAQQRAWVAFEVNAEGAKNAALAASEAKARYTYIGTDFIFDGKKRSAYVEDDEPNPLCIYAKSKLAGELYTQKYAQRHIILRTSWLFGIHGKNFVESILEQAGVSDLRVVDDQVGSPTYTVDLAEAMARLLMTELTGVFHCANTGFCSWFDFAEKIVEVVGLRDVLVFPIKTEELGRPALRPAFSALDNTKLCQALQITMPHWDDALKRYLQQRKQQRGG